VGLGCLFGLSLLIALMSPWTKDWVFYPKDNYNPFCFQNILNSNEFG
jgi:hypothetical protein